MTPAPANHNQEHTYIARLFQRAAQSLEALGVAKEDEARIEGLSVFIHESMSVSSRNYHSVQHVFDISDGFDDPILVLAALFHDVIYIHVDGGLTQMQARILHDVVIHKEGLPTYQRQTDNEEPIIRMVETIFGLNRQDFQSLHAMNGLNEFLSALIACRSLEEMLPRFTLAQIAACIEATVPFRAPRDGESAAERLFQNLQQANEEFALELTEDALIESVQRATLLANSDVGNFGTTDQDWFLDNTWSLLPESNESLRSEHLYTIQQFQFAVFKMHGFLQFLQPGVVFQSFRGVPSDEELNRLTTNAGENLRVGRTYVGAKLLSLSLLTALAELTGGDVPMSLFVGDLPSRHHWSMAIEDEDLFPLREEMENPLPCDEVVYNLLHGGRRSETSFDVKQSPIAAYMYALLGDDGLATAVKECALVTPTQISPENARKFLRSLPWEPLQTVVEKLVMPMAVSRVYAIGDLMDSLREEN